MSVRVNLMLAEEFRSTSAVTTSFSPRVLAISGGAVAVTLLALGTVNYRSVHNGLALAQTRYAELEPRFLEATRVQESRNHNLNIDSELTRWTQSGVQWEAPLRALALLAPETVQFTRLNIDSSIEKPRAAGAADKDKVTPPPTRRYNIRIDGSASGELSDQTVVDFVKTLRESPAFLDWVDSVQLQGLQRATTPGAGPDDRVFRIDLRTKARDL